MREENKWKSLTPMRTSRKWFGATAIEEKIYVAGGENRSGALSSADVYDIKLNKWSPLPDMEKKRYDCAIASVNGKVYAVGGRDFIWRLSIGEIFDPATNKWTPIPDMKEARWCCAACAMGDKLYVIGGNNYDGHNYKSLSSVDVFDTITQEWSSIPNMKTKRNGCAAVSLKNKIYVFGGHDGYNFLSSAEVYDITTQEWTQLPEMKEKRKNCAVTVVGNRIYVVGGYNFCSKFHQCSCEVFDTYTNTWSSPIPDMNEKRCGCQAVSIGSKIYVMGDGDYSTFATSFVEVFEMSMDSFYPIDDNYVIIKDGCYSPKSLENLSIDQMCRSLPDLDGEIPPKYPQHVINTILHSLESHDALTLIPLEAFKHYKLDQLTAVNKRLLLLSESVSEPKFKRFKFDSKSKL